MMLSFQNITFQYKENERPLFKNLSFSVSKGDFVIIIGSSGCGKTTLFRLINGLEQPSSGEILIDNQPIRGHANCAYMPQKDLLFPWRTIGRNLLLPMEIQKISRDEQKQRANTMLKEIGLETCYNKYPNELSGGMRQRVSFARTMLTGSNLLLLDEPFSALDSLTKLDMQEWLLKQWKHFHNTILFITHDVDEAILLGRKILIMEKQPVQTLYEIDVPLPDERNHSIFKKSEIINLKEKLVAQLRGGAL